MIFARAMAIACCTVLKFMFWGVGGLLVLVTAVQALRGDEFAQPVTMLTASLVAAGAGFGCHWIATRFEKMN